MEGYVAVREGSSPGARLFGTALEQIREEAVGAGLITNEEIDRMLILLDDPGFAFGAPILFTAWGRRPSSTLLAPSAREDGHGFQLSGRYLMMSRA
jgi:hypothetical protein